MRCLKKIITVLSAVLVLLAISPVGVFAAPESEGSAVSVPIWLCIPFAGLLLCVAVMPLLKAEWWEKISLW